MQYKDFIRCVILKIPENQFYSNLWNVIWREDFQRSFNEDLNASFLTKAYASIKNNHSFVTIIKRQQMSLPSTKKLNNDLMNFINTHS